MVADEPNDVRVERIDRRQWAVLVAENGTVTQRLFEAQEAAEDFADGSLGEDGVTLSEIHREVPDGLEVVVIRTRCIWSSEAGNIVSVNSPLIDAHLPHFEHVRFSELAEGLSLARQCLNVGHAQVAWWRLRRKEGGGTGGEYSGENGAPEWKWQA